MAPDRVRDGKEAQQLLAGAGCWLSTFLPHTGSKFHLGDECSNSRTMGALLIQTATLGSTCTSGKCSAMTPLSCPFGLWSYRMSCHWVCPVSTLATWCDFPLRTIRGDTAGSLYWFQVGTLLATEDVLTGGCGQLPNGTNFCLLLSEWECRNVYTGFENGSEINFSQHWKLQIKEPVQESHIGLHYSFRHSEIKEQWIKTQ